MKYTWLLACGLVLFYWIDKWYFSPEIPETLRIEAQGILFIFMILLSFPSGIIWYFIFSLILIFFREIGLTIPILMETLFIWVGFVLFGYFQWFQYISKIFKK